MKKYKRSLMIFRRDLRAVDNTALDAALQSSEEVLTCFIFYKPQYGNHTYRSANGLAFMIESLGELSTELEERGGKLYFFDGEPSEIVDQLITKLSIEAVFLNKDYTPFSRARDKKIFETCEKRSVAFHSFSDLLLVEPSSFGKPDGKPYTVFTPFFKRASQEVVRAPAKAAKGSFFVENVGLKTVVAGDYLPKETAPQRLSFGGRSKALEILAGIKRFKLYKQERDFPAVSGTTVLSPHNKFGTVSIREVYWAVREVFGENHDLIRELYWRDFFTHIAWHFPHVFQGAFNRTYDKLSWSGDDKAFKAWCDGRTGFPIVDAGMRQLTQTGFMHNRVRMIVASFLVKDLLIDWHRGEAFFAQHLTEYDPSVNNGSWQWAASTGCDAQPYFRIFNPWLQQEKFDPNAEYIKRWIPELATLSAKEIHSLESKPALLGGKYPRPIIEHKERKIIAEQMFRDVQGSANAQASNP